MPPLRQVTRRYPDLESFFQEYHGTLAHGALLVPADQVSGELSPELKLDLLLPVVGRVGPMNAQVVSRLPDGSYALRIPEVPPPVSVGLKRVVDAVDEVRRYLVRSGELVPASELAALREELERLRAGQPVEAPTPQAPALAAVQEAAEPEEELIDDLEEAPAPVAPPAPPTPPPAPAPRAVEPAAPVRPRAHGLATVPLVGAPLLKGAMGDPSLRRALVALALSSETGALQVNTPDRRVRIGYWRGGGAVGWRADPAVEDERLGQLLLKSGQLSAAQLSAAEREMERAQVRQGEALVRLGVVPAASLPALLARQAEFVLMRVMQERAGTWAFYRLGELPEAFPAPPVAVASILFRAVLNQARKVPVVQVSGALKKSADRTVYLRTEAVLALRDGRYSREEATVLDALRVAPQPLGAFVERGPVKVDIVGPMVYALLELGLADVGKGEDREAQSRRAAEAIAARAEIVEKGTPFDALDLHWICVPEEVQRNLARIKAELAPDVLGELTPEQRPALGALLARLDAAASTLMSGPGRREARLRLVAAEDLERCAELLREAAAEARRGGDEQAARFATAKADDLLGR